MRIINRNRTLKVDIDKGKACFYEAGNKLPDGHYENIIAILDIDEAVSFLAAALEAAREERCSYNMSHS